MANTIAERIKNMTQILGSLLVIVLTGVSGSKTESLLSSKSKDPEVIKSVTFHPPEW